MRGSPTLQEKGSLQVLEKRPLSSHKKNQPNNELSVCRLLQTDLADDAKDYVFVKFSKSPEATLLCNRKIGER